MFSLLFKSIEGSPNNSVKNREDRLYVFSSFSKQNLQDEFRVFSLYYLLIFRESDNYDDQLDEEMRALQMIQQQKRQPISKDVV